MLLVAEVEEKLVSDGVENEGAVEAVPDWNSVALAWLSPEVVFRVTEELGSIPEAVEDCKLCVASWDVLGEEGAFVPVDSGRLSVVDMPEVFGCWEVG